MSYYWDIIKGSYTGYWNYLVKEISQPHIQNYFYWLIGISILAWLLEYAFPWRRKQRIVRKDFYLDTFYMFFNFFLFSLIAYNALSNVAVELFNKFLGVFGVQNLIVLEISSWPWGLQLLVLFILADFIQWNVHRLLHRVPWLWEFHKLHHSVKEMGFAAHLRFHWMETIVYKSIQYIPLAMVGFGIQDFFIVHIFTVSIGHLNHSNLGWDYGFLKYVFNNPKMHIWHHAKELPAMHPYGMNYGLSLSVWDYLFKTAYVPTSGMDIELGFQDDSVYPKGFFKQVFYPLTRRN